jgi:hypothetical protein
MQKIPVGPTIAFAYRFLVREIGIILGICWLPAVLFAGANYFTGLYAIQNRALLDAHDPRAAGAYTVLWIFSLIVSLYASSIAAVAITRQVMGHERPPGVLLLYFAAGRSEWRMLGANIRLLAVAGVLVFMALFVAGLAFVIAGVPVDAPEKMTLTAATITAALIAVALVLYASVSIVQIGFLLPSTVTMEEKGGLRRAYELSKGNTLRVLAIALALGLPIFLLLFGADAAILRSAIGPNIIGLSPSELTDRAVQAFDQKLIYWQIFTAIVFILGSGLVFSGAAFAYRARTSAEV